jgi:hypothetical protein
MDKQTNEGTDIWINRQMKEQTDEGTDDEGTDRWMDRQTNRGRER